MLGVTSDSGLVIPALVGAVLILLGTTVFFSGPLLKWADRKRYQYEVTMPLSMLTSTEKFIFNSIVFLFFSMIIIATLLYLPDKLVYVFHRVYYYVAGADPSL